MAWYEIVGIILFLSLELGWLAFGLLGFYNLVNKGGKKK